LVIFLHQAAQVIQVAGQVIHAVYHDRITFTDEAKHGLRLRTLGILGRGLVGEQFVHLVLFQLTFRVLFVAVDPDIADTLPLQGASLGYVDELTAAPTTLLTNPRIGERLEEFEPRDVRRIQIGQYEMRYEIVDSTIYLLRLWHTREDR
jgi:hypothetical protein|tara:strand:+ start:10294 stop:10740 length:447 start_codon:yes stop_codon:yes gene_type:complete